VKYLADTSVWNRGQHPEIRSRWEELILRDEILVCDQVVLEVLFSAQSAKEYDQAAINFSGSTASHRVPRLLPRWPTRFSDYNNHARRTPCREPVWELAEVKR
jgi:hypothetical protein